MGNVDLGCVGKTTEPFVLKYDWRDAALYALGLAAGTPDLKYLTDKPPARLLPTFGVVPAFAPVFEALGATGGNMVTLLHSGQRTEQLRPFPPSGELHTQAVIRGVWDMKIGALVIIDTESKMDGEPVARTAWQLLLRGEGGFGGERPPALLRARPPADKEPDFAVEVPTTETQALLYRLNGDINPIHADPRVAKEAGFDRPILHGLCYFGVAARIALRELAGDDPDRFTAYESRFAKIVFPGDTLLVQGWRLEEPGRAVCTVSVKETGEKAIASSVFEFTP